MKSASNAAAGSRADRGGAGGCRGGRAAGPGFLSGFEHVPLSSSGVEAPKEKILQEESFNFLALKFTARMLYYY